ncbi:GspH/FimT family pseudopilin [Halomonas saccharevitans]|uniref:GspH/FimT family pseudopilin n=1 Tax=Halomonas saccharevitans TaxID=416872 RepID=UPI000B7E5293|nr:GspH/FimT family pseudopilin [Halomonas saccharevitans]
MKVAKGFTLIELLVTVAVIIIMATIAVPGFQRMMASSQLASDYNEMLSGLHLARSEAVKRRQDVSLKPKINSYEVVFNGGALRSRDSLKSTVALSNGEGAGEEVSFNKLGRIVKSSYCEDGCTLTISYSGAGSKAIYISGFGRVGRGGS